MPGEEEAVVTGSITLSEQAIRNLGVESAEAVLTPLQQSLTMVARIEPLPEKHAQVTARFSGRVLEILAKVGERVTKDQPLLTLDPVTIGNPPVILRSPLDGFVLRQDLTLGKTFTPETVLMEVADYRKVQARGILYENAKLSEINVGQSVRVEADAYPGLIFSGTVQRVDVGLEPHRRTFEVFAILENPHFKLRPNMQASLALGLGEAAEVLAVPHRAILGEAGNYFIFVQKDKTFEKRPVLLGIRAGDRTEIMEGVFPGERVVTQGNYQLQYASSTAATTPAPAPAAETSGSAWRWIIAILILLAVGAVVVFTRCRRF